jgi:glycosyltransferase involved in cell wall biosynthesis
MSALQELKQLAALSADPVEAPAAPFNAYVHVAYGYDARTWQQNWRAGKILGLNEEFPYGYHHAAQFGATVIYSKDHPENALQKIMRYGLRFFLGFDFIHAWRNRAEILRSDVVWTHTESQTLAVLGLLTISKHAARPKLIGQVIWLIDEWHRLNYFRKALYTRLLAKADILTFLSPFNAGSAAALFPRTRVEFIKFGINTNFPALPRPVFKERKIRVLSVGNDRHRDWATLIDATGDKTDIEVRLLTTKYKLGGEYDNISVLKVQHNDDLLSQFAWADMLVLPLQPNFHASGITVIEEAAILGVPVKSTNVGGLEAYFQEEDVLYVDPGDSRQMASAIRHLARNPELQQSLIANSRRRLTEAGLSSRHYAKRHVELFRELCAQ